MSRSKFPWFTGRVTDVESSRALVKLAQRFSGVIDLHNSDLAFASILALQSGSAMQTTFSEAQHHADLLIVLGEDSLLDDYPQLPARVLGNAPRALLLGNWTNRGMEAFRPLAADVSTIQCDLDGLPEGLTHLLESEDSSSFLGWKHAKHPVLIWSNRRLPGVRATDLWISRLNRALVEANKSIRAFGLPLSGSEATFYQACTWLTSFPGRVRWVGEQWNYNPNLYRESSLLRDRRPDLRVWVDIGFDPIPVPEIDIPTIVFSCDPCASTESSRSVSTSHQLEIPIALPGIDYSAHLLRADQATIDFCGEDSFSNVDLDRMRFSSAVEQLLSTTLEHIS